MRRIGSRLTLVLLWGVLFLTGSQSSASRKEASPPATVFQYAVSARTKDAREITAFLWVPPKADRIRGVLIGGMTLMEEAFTADPLIRQVCAEEKLAIVYFVPHLDALFAEGSAALLQKALDDLATASGYPEIKTSPLFPFGHSVGSLFAGAVVAWAPQRCFGALLFKGAVRAPAAAAPDALAGVPLLAVKGQFEEFGPGPDGFLRSFEDRQTSWQRLRDTVLDLRAKNPRHLVSLLVEPGATHFAWSEPTARYVAAFLREAARRRIPEGPPDALEPVRCREITPESGALTDGSIAPHVRAAATASYHEYKGDRRNALWHLSLDLARQNDAYHRELRGKQPQFVTFAHPDTGEALEVGSDLRLRLPPPQWIGPDTFRVTGTFHKTVPDRYPPAETNQAIGHAPGPIRFRAHSGAVEQVGHDTFRVALNGRARLRIELLSYHPGDRVYRYAEQPGRLTLPEQLTEGRKQTILFPPVATLRVGGAPQALKATSDSGLPVRFYVESGPARIENDTLVLADVPARASFPLRVVVVAYQYGSAIAPLVQSAAPVRQTVQIER